MSAPTTTVVQCVRPRPDASGRLVCFPHAGGSPSFFRGWDSGLPDTEVYGVCYGGRAHRSEEPPPADLLRLAAEVADAVEPLADRPLALFGHSMGAPVALETARLLERRGIRIRHLFASGSRDGECPEPADPDDDPDAVMRRLVDLGGTDPAMADDPDFRELVLPYVMSDSHMFHRYVMRPGPVLRCPVTALVGDADTEADRRPWRRLTTGPYAEVTVTGAHFYLRDDPPFALLRWSPDRAGNGAPNHWDRSDR